jgi:hypothetical protein
VWTGREMIVWGGYRLASSGAPAWSDATLAYDPRSDKWRTLASSADVVDVGPNVNGQIAAWDGRRVVVVRWGERKVVAATFDPSVDRWTTTGPPPISSDGGATAAFAGGATFVWDGRGAVYRSP